MAGREDEGRGTVSTPAGTPAGGGTPGTTKIPATPQVQSGDVTITDAHDMFIAIGIMVGFVMFATILAGFNQEVGHAMLALMFLLLLLQGIGHVNPFAQWVVKHPLQPKGTIR